jgi:hypothetical protein
MFVQVCVYVCVCRVELTSVLAMGITAAAKLPGL